MRCAIVALALLAPAAALAGSNPALEEQKEDLKELREYDRDVRKVARKFDRAVRRDREDKRAELLVDIAEIGRIELVRLRRQGISTRVPPLPSQPRKMPPAEHPKRQELWDALVDLRELAASDRERDLTRASRLLGVVSQHVDDRTDRAEERYEAAKSGA